MKIAIVLNTSWNIYNFRKGLVESFLSNGHEVFTIAPHDKYSAKLASMGCKHYDVKMDSRGVNPVKDFLLTMELRSIYKQIKPDIVLHYTIKPNIYGTIAASTLNIPVINNVCGLGTVFLDKSLASNIAILLYKLAFRFPKKIFFQNNDDLTLFKEKKIVKSNNCEILPGSGIDLSRFKPSKKRNSSEFTFLLISRLIYDKGILEYIEAIDQLRAKGIDAKFQILGAIDEKHRRGIPERIVNEWINENKIEYLGTTDDVRSFIDASDCIVLPSYREGTPKTLLEAASMGKPLIATNVPGCNNIVVDNHNGYLCKLRNAKDLADKMEMLTKLTPDKIAIMGQNSRSEVEKRFDEKIVIDKYHKSIELLTK